MNSPEAFFVTYDTMTTPASGVSTSVQLGDEINTRNYVLFTTVANINTNVVVALNGSIDGTNWSNIIANQTITGNGTTHYNIANCPVKYVQPVFVSQSGGIAAAVLFSVGAN